MIAEHYLGLQSLCKSNSNQVRSKDGEFLLVTTEAAV